MTKVQPVPTIPQLALVLDEYRELAAIKEEIEAQMLAHKQLIMTHMQATAQKTTELAGFKVTLVKGSTSDKSTYDIAAMLEELPAATMAALVKVQGSKVKELLSIEDREAFAIGGIIETTADDYIRLVDVRG